MFVLDNDERIAELQQAWDELVAIAEAFACDEGELDQELFRDVLLKTWKLFSERIDFDAKYSEYCLPIGMAYVFGRMMEYSDKKQVTEREDDGDIELSARIVKKLVSSIMNRDMFPRDEPVIECRMKIDGTIIRLVYNCETGVLRVSEKSKNKPNDKVLEINDISRWWDME